MSPIFKLNFLIAFSLLLANIEPGEGKCVDTNNDFTDYEGNSCEWYEWEYDYCGDYDDDDFDADKMCCSCGGGYDPPTHRGASCNGQKGAKNNPDCKPGETCVSRFMYIGECKVV